MLQCCTMQFNAQCNEQCNTIKRKALCYAHCYVAGAMQYTVQYMLYIGVECNEIYDAMYNAVPCNSYC